MELEDGGRHREYLVPPEVAICAASERLLQLEPCSSSSGGADGETRPRVLVRSP